MIFLGDIAIPNGIKPQIDNIYMFRDKIVVANLEGLIAKEGQVSILEDKLFSNPCVVDFLKTLNVKAVSLANNHVTDVPTAWDNTKTVLNENKINFFGAGKSLESASQAVEIDDDGIPTVLVAFGWKVISCIYAKEGQFGVNPLEAQHVIATVNELRKAHPDKRLVAIMHWDYELERYPMPAQRKLAKRMIDEGADVIIGHHPHCVQGIEYYKNKPIVYSLGNWFIPQGIFMGGRLKFPNYAKEEFAVEIIKNDLVIHRFEYEEDKERSIFKLSFIDSMPVKESQQIVKLTPYIDFKDKDYYVWFAKNRYKKKGLPIYKDFEETFINRSFDCWIKLRQQLINFIFKIGLKERTETND